jgi:hypothetical protein
LWSDLFFPGLFFSDLWKEAMTSNKTPQPTTGRCEVPLYFMKQFSIFATVALTGGGSAYSR